MKQKIEADRHRTFQLDCPLASRLLSVALGLYDTAHGRIQIGSGEHEFAQRLKLLMDRCLVIRVRFQLLHIRLPRPENFPSRTDSKAALRKQRYSMTSRRRSANSLSDSMKPWQMRNVG